MPTAPLYGGQKVNESVTPQVRANTNASAADYGAAVAQGVGQLGEAATGLGQAIATREALIARANASEAKAKAEEQSLRYNAILTADRERIQAAYATNPSEGVKQWQELQPKRRKEMEEGLSGNPMALSLFSEDVVKHEYSQNGQVDSFFIKKQIDREDELAAASISSDTEKAGKFLASGDVISANLYLSGAEKNIRARGALLNTPPAAVDALVQDARGGAALSAIRYAAQADTQTMLQLASDPKIVASMSLAQRTEAKNILNNIAKPQMVTLAAEAALKASGGDMRLIQISAEQISKETGGAVLASDIVKKSLDIRTDQDKAKTIADNDMFKIVSDDVANGGTYDQYVQRNPNMGAYELAQTKRVYLDAQESISRGVDATQPEALRKLSQLAISNSEAIPAYLAENARRVTMSHRKEFMDIANDPAGEGGRRASEIDKLAKDSIDRLALADNEKYGMKGGAPIDAASYNRAYQAIRNEVARSYADPKRNVDPSNWAAWYKGETRLHDVDPSVIEGLQPISPDPNNPAIRGAGAAFAGNDEGAMRKGHAVALSMVKTASQFGEMDSPRYYAAWTQMGVSEGQIKANRAAHVGMDPAEADAMLAAEIPARWEAENPGYVRQAWQWASGRINANVDYIEGSWNKLDAAVASIPGVGAANDFLINNPVTVTALDRMGMLGRGLRDAVLQLSQPGFQMPAKPVDK
jgi:hypothetical protein